MNQRIISHKKSAMSLRYKFAFTDVTNILLTTIIIMFPILEECVLSVIQEACASDRGQRGSMYILRVSGWVTSKVYPRLQGCCIGKSQSACTMATLKIGLSTVQSGRNVN